MKNIKRAIHIDFHTMPEINDFGRNIDAEEFADTLKTSNVTYVNIFASCNIGFCYYPTKTGIGYPNMQGDLFGSLLKACHNRDIGVTGYINVGLNHSQAHKHIEWCKIDSEGRVYRGDRSGNFFRTMCYNTGYRDYLLAIIKEICEYNIDGLFCDCMLLEECYCPACMEKMIEQNIEINSKEAVMAFQLNSMRTLCEEIKLIVGNDKNIVFNGMPVNMRLNSHGELECLPSGEWGYDYFAQHAAYLRTLYDKLVYMSGRFQSGWGDFGGIKSRASFENDIFDALLNGFEISIGDHMHPAKGLNKDLYRLIGELYQKLIACERWTVGAKYFADIAILCNGELYELTKQQYVGVTRMLGELKYTFNIIDTLADFSSYQLIIMPDEFYIEPNVAIKLKEYIAAGGKILSSGKAGLSLGGGFALKDEYSFLEYIQSDPENCAYFKFKDEDCEWAMYQPSIKVKNKCGRQIADYIKAYFSKHSNGIHGYFYTPPKESDGCAAAVIGDEVAHICFDVFSAYAKHFLCAHKTLVEKLLSQLIDKPLIVAKELPSTVRTSITGCKEYSLLHIKTSYPEKRNNKAVIEEHNILPAGNKIAVRGDFSKAESVFTGEKFDMHKQNGYSHLCLPLIDGYQMFKLS